jgi:dsDNA-binding SOS-regulon protein
MPNDDDIQREGLDVFPDDTPEADQALDRRLRLADEVKRLLSISELREAEDKARELFKAIDSSDEPIADPLDRCLQRADDVKRLLRNGQLRDAKEKANELRREIEFLD